MHRGALIMPLNYVDCLSVLTGSVIRAHVSHLMIVALTVNRQPLTDGHKGKGFLLCGHHRLRVQHKCYSKGGPGRQVRGRYHPHTLRLAPASRRTRTLNQSREVHGYTFRKVLTLSHHQNPAACRAVAMQTKGKHCVFMALLTTS